MYLKLQQVKNHLPTYSSSIKLTYRYLALQYLLFFTLFLVLSPYSRSNENDSFNVIVINYPPFVDESANNNGISIELLTRLLSKFNHPFQLIFSPPARAQKLITTEEYLITILPPSGDRSEFLRYEVDSKDFNYTLFQLTQSEAEWSELKGKNIGSLDFRYGQPYLELLEKEGANIILVPNFTSGLKMLNAGRVDFLIGIDQTIFDVAQELDMADDIIANEVPITSFGALAFYVNTKHPLALKLADYLENQKSLKISENKLSVD